jgi:hypothetical protein
VRHADCFGLLVGTGILLLTGCTVYDIMAQAADQERLLRNKQLVLTLQLTDLALLTEARYTRHPSQADRHAPFQDHPLALDHFPSGSFWKPPRQLR